MLPSEMVDFYSGDYSLVDVAACMLALHAPGSWCHIPGVVWSTTLVPYSPSLYGFIMSEVLLPYRKGPGGTVYELTPVERKTFKLSLIHFLVCPPVFEEMIIKIAIAITQVGLAYDPAYGLHTLRHLLMVETDPVWRPVVEAIEMSRRRCLQEFKTMQVPREWDG